MRQAYKKDGVIRSFVIRSGKVIATVKIGGVWVSNPTLAAFLAEGWQEYKVPEPEQYTPTYAELVEQYIREHGYPTYGAELAVLNNHAADPDTYATAYADYMQTRQAAKEWANSQPHREEDML